MPRVLIVDDDPDVRETMISLLRRQRISHDQAADLAATRRALQANAFDLLLLDVGWQG